MLSNGHRRDKNYALAAFVIGVCTLAMFGAFVIVWIVAGWLT